MFYPWCESPNFQSHKSNHKVFECFDLDNHEQYSQISGRIIKINSNILQNTYDLIISYLINFKFFLFSKFIVYFRKIKTV